MKATWQSKLLAESDATVEVDGNHYFPADSLKREHLKPSETTSMCPWPELIHRDDDSF